MVRERSTFTHSTYAIGGLVRCVWILITSKNKDNYFMRNHNTLAFHVSSDTIPHANLEILDSFSLSSSTCPPPSLTVLLHTQIKQTPVAIWTKVTLSAK